MLHVICGLSVSTVFCTHYLTNGTIFEKKIVDHTMCVLTVSKHLSEIVFVLRRTERDMIINVYRSSCEVPNIFVEFYSNFSFLYGYSKNIRISNFTKVRPMGAGLFYADWRTDGQTARRADTTKLRVAFRNFVKALKKCHIVNVEIWETGRT